MTRLRRHRAPLSAGRRRADPRQVAATNVMMPSRDAPAVPQVA